MDNKTNFLSNTIIGSIAVIISLSSNTCDLSNIVNGIGCGLHIVSNNEKTINKICKISKKIDDKTGNKITELSEVINDSVKTTTNKIIDKSIVYVTNTVLSKINNVLLFGCSNILNNNVSSNNTFGNNTFSNNASNNNILNSNTFSNVLNSNIFSNNISTNNTFSNNLLNNYQIAKRIPERIFLREIFAEKNEEILSEYAIILEIKSTINPNKINFDVSDEYEEKLHKIHVHNAKILKEHATKNWIEYNIPIVNGDVNSCILQLLHFKKTRPKIV